MSPGRKPGRTDSVAMAGGGTEGVGGAEGIGGLAHAASRALAIISGRCRPATRRITHAGHLLTSPGRLMTLLLLEALGALLLLVFIVWWTMFSGRKKGELRDEADGASDRDGEQK